MWPSLLDAAMPETVPDDAARGLPQVDATRRLRGLPASNADCAAATPTRSTRCWGLRRSCSLIAAANLCALVFARTESRRQELARQAGARLGTLARGWRSSARRARCWASPARSAASPLRPSRATRIIRFLVRDYTVRTSLNTSPDTTVMAVATLASVGVAIAVTVAAAVAATRHGGLTLGGIAYRGAIVANRTHPGRRADRRVDRDARACVAAGPQRLQRSPPWTRA